MLKPLYGMLRASILHCKQFVNDTKAAGYEINPYDPCAANKVINGKQCTIAWHADDVKSSHHDPEVNANFAKWCEEKYGSEELGHTRVTRGKTHDYLGMTLDYATQGKLKVDMRDHISNMKKEWPHEIKREKKPWSDNLLKADAESKALSEKESKHVTRLL